MCEATKIPTKVLIENAGLDSPIIINKLLSKNNLNYGFNVNTEKFVNMSDNGIIDPIKVVRIAIQNAVSIASLMTTTEAIVVNTEEPDLGGMPGGGMPGMGGGMGGMPGMGGMM